MSSSDQPIDSKKENQPLDTSEQLEVNEPGQESGADAQEDLASLLKEAQDQVAQYHEELLRAKAEVENIRRRSQEDVSKARKFGTESFAESLVPVKDSLEAALALADQTPEAWRAGVEATLKQLVGAFERNLLKEVAPAPGEKFDPHVHQAISALPSELPEGAVVQMLQKGYTIAERVLRPALVTVSSGQSA
ncbi:nucleotide exchange factor GrpE [Eoetvoesiella caeni]|uniref:Protein GrpE n=1 Tax=Eoetvoesiella caeni TaxID=645616 RepID=A0A366H688_9BURK|nr:nucleotide exchange factor GrpE [Eoetvoesiella caeni]MCI2810489.1 nucleotide exchange factor GrpE [Eoetvoesiella caeni]NYT54839.1 nucleotide exchange factor GrpE [Eoetvoesiella caeni]RBP36753.1 molecular chaperone GrpE [Eoetvoesiella caeni]